MLKQKGKHLLVRILGSQVRRLVRAHEDLKVVAVSGSVGKTSTKLAIAHVLGSELKVRYQDGNYNDLLSVPLIFFGHKMPRIWNILAWIWILIKNEWNIHDGYPYDVVMVELGLHTPGILPQFGKYLNPDHTVITAIAAEHMEFYDSIDAIAAEEMSVVEYSQKLLLNISDIDQKYLPKKGKISTYGLTRSADNAAATGPPNEDLTRPVMIALKGEKPFTIKLLSPSKSQLKSVLAAASIANEMGLSVKQIMKSLENLPQVQGRMQVLSGIKGSKLLDDTYNANPASVESALKLLYEITASQRIAILGSMNELGNFSRKAHEEIGTFCDPKKLDLVVTIGHDAYRYLAPTAESVGCKVERFLDPVAAGQCVSEILKKGAVVLAKGSQNNVFAEEALKCLLEDPDDKQKLVRQSRGWLKIKRKQFPSIIK